MPPFLLNAPPPPSCRWRTGSRRDYIQGMCGRVIQSSEPLRYAIVDGMNVRDSRVHNYPPRWKAAPSQELLVIRRNHRNNEASLDPLRWGLIPKLVPGPDRRSWFRLSEQSDRVAARQGLCASIPPSANPNLEQTDGRHGYPLERTYFRETFISGRGYRAVG